MSPSLFQAILDLRSNQQIWEISNNYSKYLMIAQIARHASGTSLAMEHVWDILCEVLTQTQDRLSTRHLYHDRSLPTQQRCSLQTLEQTECTWARRLILWYLC
jgi:hypothetical protein